MKNKQVKLIYTYMGWDFEQYLLGDCSHPFDSNTAYKCVQEMERRKDWGKCYHQIVIEHRDWKSRQHYLSPETFGQQELVSWLMNPKNFFNCMVKWLEVRTKCQHKYNEETGYCEYCFNNIHSVGGAVTNAEKFAKLNGIEWHEYEWVYIDESLRRGHYLCEGCGHETMDFQKENPTFTDAKSIIEVMMKREDWDLFSTRIGNAWYAGNGYTNKIDIYYVQNADKLLDEAIKWCEENPL